ncbi:outer membrane protein [Helicobacter salomonis]|nr:outer membrane protein [Helicobacter salomonis]
MWLVLLAALSAFVHAESDGVYVQVGFQYSRITQDSATSEISTQVVQKKIDLAKVFPETGWHAPGARDVPFKSPPWSGSNNPQHNRFTALGDIEKWNGKSDIDAAVVQYEESEQLLIPAWVSYTIESAQAATPSAPSSVVGNLLDQLGGYVKFTMDKYKKDKFDQVPRLVADYAPFEATSQQVAKSLGISKLSWDLEGSATISTLQAQMSILENAANTLTKTLFNTLISAPNGNLVVPNPTQRSNIGSSIRYTVSRVSALSQAAQKVLKEYYQAYRTEFWNSIETIPSTMQHRYTSANLYGFNMQVGYKQFFGRNERWGLRYYGGLGYSRGKGAKQTYDISNVVYGVGVDGLCNFFESEDHNTTSGLFLGLMLTGSSWIINSAMLQTALSACKSNSACKLQMGRSYFQLPLTFGFRTNVGEHNGFEIGTHIPLLSMPRYYATTSTDYGTMGIFKTAIGFKRNVSMYFN